MNRWHAGRTLPQVLSHYAIAVVTGILAMLARDAAAPVIGAGSPWLFLYPVSVILALYFGTGPALMASLAGSITAAAIFDLDRQHTLQGAVVMLTAGFTAWVVAGRRQLALALRDSEDRFRTLFEAAPIGIAQISQNGRLITVNPALCRLLGYTAHELRTKSMRDIVHPEDLPGEARILQRMQDAGTDSWIQEQRLLHRDGTPIGVSVASTAVRDAGGTSLSRIAVVADVREQRRAAAELERAVRIRDEFLAIASHELRTPLTALLLQIGSLLRRGVRRPDQAPLPEWAVRKLRAGEQQVLRLSTLTNNLLDVSKLTTGQLALSPEPMDLVALVREVAEHFRDDLANAGCPLTIEAPAAVYGHWDRLRLEHVVTNLLSNAIKYGPGQPIDIHIRTDGPTATLQVIDRGIGIAAEDQARIFGRFERGVSYRNYGGFGVGLWIAREALTAMGGHLHVQSVPGQGATFTVTLPLPAAGGADVDRLAT